MPMKQKIQRQPRHRQERPESLTVRAPVVLLSSRTARAAMAPGNRQCRFVFRWDPRRGLGVNSLSIVLCVKPIAPLSVFVSVGGIERSNQRKSACRWPLVVG
jgi:hypothetical protein